MNTNDAYALGWNMMSMAVHDAIGSIKKVVPEELTESAMAGVVDFFEVNLDVE